MKTKHITFPLLFGKLAVALTALAVTVFTASCNDEDLTDAGRSYLQLSVTTDTPVLSRAIVNDKYLPDKADIGVTLTATDGSAYDGMDFINLKYTASGWGDAQTWSSETPASLSTTTGKVVAYYPHNPDITTVAGLAAIPVETASQTDYMYAKPVTGINFTSAQTGIIMQHALTNIRINLKKGTYTGPGNVGKVSVKAPGFATNATMHAETGALAGVTGSGAEYIQEFTDLTLSESGYNQDFITVPYPSSTSGDVTIFVTIDDKKFNAVVPYTEAFQQGYSYVYNLTLDNEALTFKGVDVTKWNVKAKEEQVLEFYDNQYIVEIQVPSDGYAYYHNINIYDVDIDWGDGVVENVSNTSNQASSTSAYPSHVYEKAGTYRIIASGNIKYIRSDNASKIITDIINIGVDCGVWSMFCSFDSQSNLKTIKKGAFDGLTEVTNFGCAFEACKNLTEIPNRLFDKCTEVTSFSNTFAYCSALTNIPAGLFDYNTKVTNFHGTFMGCDKLTAIPEGLFDHCPEVEDFENSFDGINITEIPEGLFDKCTKVKDFRNTFRNCSNLVSIPEGLFDACTEVTSFQETFYQCVSLQETPEGLFDKCTKVTNFNSTFYNCKNIQSVQKGIFDNCTEVTDFNSTFERCSNLTTIPEGLFDACTKVTSFQHTFNDCNKLQSIPEGLFDYNTEVTSFYKIFYRCYALKNIPEGLFDKCTKVTSFEGTFVGCSALTSIPEGLFDSCTEVTEFSSTFGSCTKITVIPVGLFDKCTKVTSFEGTFSSTSITTIPEGLFDKCTKVTNFAGTFGRCTSLKAIPEGLFKNNTKVISFASTFCGCVNLIEIPEGLFDSCTEVTSFSYTFGAPSGWSSYYCRIIEIPSALFDKCTKVTDFSYTFDYCRTLTGESPYTIINVNGEDVKVRLYERSNYPEYFIAPTSYSYCFRNCSGLTDYSSIPSTWL